MLLNNYIKYNGRKYTRVILCTLALIITGSSAVWAKGATGQPPQSSLDNPMALTLVAIIGALLLIIALLAHVVKGSVDVRRDQILDKKNEPGGSMATTAIAVVLLLIAGLFSTPAFAQDAAKEATAAVAATSATTNVSGSAFNFMIAIIALEVLVIFVLLYNLQLLLGIGRKSKKAALAAAGVVSGKPKLSWWDRFNSLKPIEQEADIELDHNYDGIRELDNRLPPWWLYGFYITIIFAGIYLWRYHVSHSGPSSTQEYEMAVAQADKEHEEYLKKAGNSVDENTVKLLTDQKDISAGAAIFTNNCVTCHGEGAKGMTGPNLTDDYWLHGGRINDLFKTIKYGVQGKAMQSWESRLSPLQIAQVASYVKSLHGTNPPGGLPAQGELYKEDAAPAAGGDSTKPAAASPAAAGKPDSAATIAK